MNTFRLGSKVLFSRGVLNHVGTIEETARIDGQDGYTIAFAGGRPATWDPKYRFATANQLIALPDDTPEFHLGDVVEVAADAPEHAGRRGEAGQPTFHGTVFGYKVWLSSPAERVWVPAALLTPVVSDGGAS